MTISKDALNEALGEKQEKYIKFKDGKFYIQIQRNQIIFGYECDKNDNVDSLGNGYTISKCRKFIKQKKNRNIEIEKCIEEFNDFKNRINDTAGSIDNNAAKGRQTAIDEVKSNREKKTAEWPEGFFDIPEKYSNELKYCCLEEELDIIREYNKLVKTDNHKISLNALFEYNRMGDIEKAKLLILQANPGLEPSDISTLNDPAMRKYIDEDRRDLISFSKESRKKQHTMFTWAKNHIHTKTKPLCLWNFFEEYLNTKDENTIYDYLEHHLAYRELFYYHSREFNFNKWEAAVKHCKNKKYTVHQEQVFNDVKKAMGKNIPIIVARSWKYWKEYIPELVEYERLFFCSSKSNVCITADNLLNRQNNKSGAWEQMIALLKSDQD